MDALRPALDRALAHAYRIERELGGGGMSRVFLAEEVALGRRVVVKVLPPETAATVDVVRFRREIRLAAALQHPGIVPLLTADAGGETLWFAMPYVTGESLRQRLAGGPLPVDDATRYWRDLLEALEHAHERGIVHRDVKPENVLLSGRHVVVTDFGVAKAIVAATTAADVTGTHATTHATTRGLVIGTPAYMAPEQAAGEAVDARADVYAAGLVMYEMLAGHGPFRATTPQALLRAQFAEPPPPLARGDVPAPLAALVLRCLAKAPEDRPASATAVLQALDAMAAGGASAAPAGRRRRWPLVTAGMTLAALAAGAVTAWRARAAGGLYPWQPEAPWLDSARVSVAILPVAHAPGDSLLARPAEEALHQRLRTDQRLLVISPTTLRRLQGDFGIPPAAASGDSAVALLRDLALRAYVRPSVGRVDGGGYLVTVEARAAAGDSVLASVQVPAAAAGEVVPAVATAAGEVRAALSRGFGRLERSPGDGRFLGGALESRRLFLEASRAFDRSDFLRVAEQMRQAVRIDSTFALGWMYLGWSLTGAGVGRGEMLAARSAAYRHRATMRSPGLQLFVEADYFRVLGDVERAVDRYRRAVRLLPDTAAFEINLALAYELLGQPETAVRIFARKRDTTYRRPHLGNAAYVRVLLELGRVDEAADEVRRLDSVAGPANAIARTARRFVAIGRRDLAALARASAAELREAQTPSARLATTAAALTAATAGGRLRLVDSLTAPRADDTGGAAAAELQLAAAAWRAQARAELTGDTLRAGRELDAARRAVPWTSVPPLDRPYVAMTAALVALGRLDAARALHAELDAAVPAEWRGAFAGDLAAMRGEIALAAGDGAGALAAFRDVSPGACPACAWPRYARAHDALGHADSAVHWYERYLASTSGLLRTAHAFELARAYRRLGELYERLGDARRAIQRYGDFVELWRDADPELQPAVHNVRARIARLQARSG